MAFSLDDALTALRQWSMESSAVQIGFIGRGIRMSYARGIVADVSGKTFTFSSESLRASFDTGFRSTVQLVPLGKADSTAPPEIKEFISRDDECALVFRGELNDILVVLKKK